MLRSRFSFLPSLGCCRCSRSIFRRSARRRRRGWRADDARLDGGRVTDDILGIGKQRGTAVQKDGMSIGHSDIWDRGEADQGLVGTVLQKWCCSSGCPRGCPASQDASRISLKSHCTKGHRAKTQLRQPVAALHPRSYPRAKILSSAPLPEPPTPPPPFCFPQLPKSP